MEVMTLMALSASVRKCQFVGFIRPGVIGFSFRMKIEEARLFELPKGKFTKFQIVHYRVIGNSKSYPLLPGRMNPAT
jgi:hypothetical protein